MSVERKEIAVFPELENQGTQPISPEDLEKRLNGIANSGFHHFSPQIIGIRALIMGFGDSYYGARIGVVKEIIAQAIYTPAAFADYLTRTSIKLQDDYVEELKGLEQKGQETPSVYEKVEAFLRTFKGTPSPLRKLLGKGLERRAWLKEIGQEKVASLKAQSDAYLALAVLVKEIGEHYKGISVADILRLSELNHLFSGKWNSPVYNLAFTDQTIRGYGAKLQLLVHQIWFGGTSVSQTLTNDELYPVRY